MSSKRRTISLLKEKNLKRRCDMAKVNFKNKKSLQLAKHKMLGVISYRQMKDGRIIAAKWPVKKRKKRNIRP